MKSLNYKSIVSALLCIIMLIMCFQMFLVDKQLNVFAAPIDIREQVTIGENLYTADLSGGVPSEWKQYEDEWMWNPYNWVYGGTTWITGSKTPVVTLNDYDRTKGTGAVVFPSVGTSNYVLTVQMFIDEGSTGSSYGLMTNIKDPLSSATGATLSYFKMNGKAIQSNRWGNGSEEMDMEYTYSKIGSTVKEGVILTLQAYSVDGYTYFYINDELVTYGAQRNPETGKSLCGLYTVGGKMAVMAVSIDAFEDSVFVGPDEEIPDEEESDVRDQLSVGENLYTAEMKDGEVPSDWTQYAGEWMWNPYNWVYGGTTWITGSKTPVVTLNDYDRTKGTGAVVFPSVGTSNYVLTVQMFIDEESTGSSYGLMTNIKDPLSSATGATLSYFKMNGTTIQSNRWGNGSEEMDMEYTYSKIGDTIKAGVVLTLKAYSIEGYTYFYVNDELVTYGLQKNPETEKSLCGLYTVGGKMAVMAVSIDKLNLVNGSFNPDNEKPEEKPDEKPDEKDDIDDQGVRDQFSIGNNLYTAEIKEGEVPSDWTQYEGKWLWNPYNWVYGGTTWITGSKTPIVTLNDYDRTKGTGAVVFPSVGTSNYVLTVQMFIDEESTGSSYGLMTNIKEPLSSATGATLSYFKMNGTTIQSNRWGNGNEESVMAYRNSKVGDTIKAGVVLTMQAYSINGYTYFYIDDKFITCGAQKNPETEKSLCGLYTVGGKMAVMSVSIDELKLKNGTFVPVIPEIPGNVVVTPEVPGEVPAVQKYGFVDYPWNSKDHKAIKDNHIIEKGLSSDGDGYALKIDNTYSGASEAQQAIALPIEVKGNTKYLISYDFYYEKIGDTSSAYSTLWFNTSAEGQPWVGTVLNITNKDEYTPASVDEKKWITGYVYGTTAEGNGAHLALLVNVPAGSIRYIDNIVVTEVPEDQCIAMFKAGSFQSPKPIVAKKNTTISIPDLKLDSKYVFLNWLLNNEDYTESTYLLENDTLFTVKTTVKTINDGFEDTYYGEDGLSSLGLDLDWEIYDSNGKDSANVKSGRYSLHRIGKDLRYGAYCFHHNTAITKYSLAVGKVYTLSFWVKVENPVHKLGSINIASCISLCNPWDFSADEFNVVPISEIADGEWHEVSYTFMSSGEYLTLIVPGNLSIYIDDLKVEYADGAEKSENCTFEEYVPAFLTEDGKYVLPEAQSDELEKFQLVKRTEETILQEVNNDNSYLIIIVIVSAVLVLAGGTTGAILFIRKRKYRG